MPTKLVLFALVLVLLGPLAAFADDDDDRFKLFGDATNLTGGLPPAGSIHLTSHCVFTGGPPACDFNTLTFSGIDYKVKKSLTFGSIEQLSADSNVDGGNCGGGSPRFQINIDTDGDGDFDGNIFVHFGPSPSFTNCFLGWQSTGNLIGNSDTGRYDSSQVGGNGFGTYADALAAAGNKRVLGIQIVVDGGWTTQRGQAVDVDNFRVNDDVLRGGVRRDDDDDD